MGVRQGSDPVIHSIPVNFNSVVNRKFLRVAASATKPLLVKFEVTLTAAFNAGTTNQIRVGTTSGGAELQALTNLPAINTPTALGGKILTADTDIYVGLSLTGTTATTGAGYIKATLEEMNVQEPNSIGTIP